MRSCRLQRRVRCNTLHLNSPGRVEATTDALEVAGQPGGPSAAPTSHSRALVLAAASGWTLTVDAFAAESDSLLPRFFARCAEPLAEAEDALTVPDGGVLGGLLHLPSLWRPPQ
jgi:hypothetical protein